MKNSLILYSLVSLTTVLLASCITSEVVRMPDKTEGNVNDCEAAMSYRNCEKKAGHCKVIVSKRLKCVFVIL